MVNIQYEYEYYFRSSISQAVQLRRVFLPQVQSAVLRRKYIELAVERSVLGKTVAVAVVSCYAFPSRTRSASECIHTYGQRDAGYCWRTMVARQTDYGIYSMCGGRSGSQVGSRHV